MGSSPLAHVSASSEVVTFRMYFPCSCSWSAHVLESTCTWNSSVRELGLDRGGEEGRRRDRGEKGRRGEGTEGRRGEGRGGRGRTEERGWGRKGSYFIHIPIPPYTHTLLLTHTNTPTPTPIPHSQTMPGRGGPNKRLFRCVIHCSLSAAAFVAK